MGWSGGGHMEEWEGAASACTRARGGGRLPAMLCIWQRRAMKCTREQGMAPRGRFGMG
jgi:hypothetical protein